MTKNFYYKNMTVNLRVFHFFWEMLRLVQNKYIEGMRADKK